MKIVRKLLPYSFFEKIALIKFRIGIFLVTNTSDELRACYGITSELFNRGINVKKNKLKISFTHPINKTDIDFELVRMSSDIQVFRQVVFEEEYKAIIDLIRNNNLPINIMIDAGANIGLASLYIRGFFPDINIFALEPSSDTFFRLQRNFQINNLKNVTVLKKGLWSHTARLKGDYSFRDGKDWSFRLTDASPSEEALFDVISVPDILREYNIGCIDFLKIDIEGGEAEVFKKGVQSDWLRFVRLIAIEIHDEFDCRDTIEQILVANEFELSNSGELTIGINKKLRL